PRLTTSEKGKQAAKASKAKSLSVLSEVAMTEAQQLELATKRSLQQTHISQVSGSGADEGTEFIHPSLSTHTEEETRDEESFDPIPKTPENSDDEGNGEENLSINVGREEGHDEEEEEDELYRDVIIHHFMSKDPSIPRRNKGNWHYVRDDHMFSTIKLVSRHQNTQQFGALLPIELTNEDIRNSNAYKENYAVATGATPPNPKASQRTSQGTSLQDFTKDRTDLNEQLEAEVLTLSSNSSKTSYAIAADLSEMELKKILIEKWKATKEPMQTTFKIEEPSHLEFDTGADDQPIVESSHHPEWFSLQKKPPTPDRDWNKTPEPEGSTQGYPLVSVEVLRYDKMSKSEYMGIVPTAMELILEHTQQGISHEVSISLTKAGNPVKKILLRLNLSDHRKLKDGGEGTCFQLFHTFTTTWSCPTIKYKDIMKAQVHVSRLPLLRYRTSFLK
nr:hypothetical protein [Tanacetum cinerariifolium]